MCIGILGSFCYVHGLCITIATASLFFSEKKFLHDDDDSGKGPSISTAKRSTTLSEVSYCFNFCAADLVCL